MSPQPPNRDITQPRPQPNSKWICGHQELGFACKYGPSSNGRCSHVHLGDRHNDNAAENNHSSAENPCAACTRICDNRTESQAENCDPNCTNHLSCEHAETGPCIPIRAAWHFRYTLALNTAIFTGGALLLMMTLPQREAVFVPGELSHKHAQILENKVVSERCSLCHPNAHTIGENGKMLSQDELCSRCHQSHLSNLDLRSPHDMDRNQLKKLTLKKAIQHDRLVSFPGVDRDKAIANLVDYTSVSPSDSTRSDQSHELNTKPDGSIGLAEISTNCASCHTEHHGRGHDLQAITDRRCQACHVQQFESFTTGHPEFTDYPQSRPRRLAFTHQAHHDKHFAKKNESFECATCHLDTQQLGGVGSIFRTLSFETACARCHSESIQAATVEAWTMLQLPSIKADDTQQPTLGLSDWPTTAQFGYEGTVPLAMRSLLMADSTLTSMLENLPVSGDLKKLPNFATDGPNATRKVALGTRKLIEEIAAGGQAAWRKRLESVAATSVERPLNEREQRLIDDLCAGLPPDIFRQMEAAWFGNTESLASSPSGLTARLVSTNTGEGEDEESLLGAEESASSNVGSLLSDATQSIQTEYLNSEADALLMGTDNRGNAQSNSSDADELLLGDAPNKRQPESRKTTAQKLTKFRGAVHVLQGGWYLDNETLALRYMPRGHADRTLAAWVEFATLITSHNTPMLQVENNSAAKQSHPTLASQVPGGCTQCHQIDSIGGSQELSVWKGYSQPVSERRLTKFDHTPHLTLPTLASCTHCHEFDRGQGDRLPKSELVSKDVELETAASRSKVSCEFKSLRLEQCNACHRPNGANAGCVQCHNYHVTAP